MSPRTATAQKVEEVPGLRALERLVLEMADGLKPSLQFQLKQLARDLKLLGATDHKARHLMKALIEEIRAGSALP